MKKLLLISVLLGLLPLSMAAQVDDLYFVPKKKSATKVTDRESQSRDVYYSGSDRSIDEYNRRVGHFDLIAQDSTLNDTINFSAEKGVFPDSTSTEDFELTRQMSRFDDYSITDNDAFWAGYAAGRYDWGWHSPWYYSRFGWYDPWYTPWYYGGWYWNDPWFYSSYYGWYGSWYGYYPYYSWYGPWYGYHTYYYTAGSGHYYTTTGHSGTINLRGGSRVMSHGSGAVRNGGGRLVGTNRGIERSERLRNRTVGTSRTTSGNRSSATRNNSNFNGGSRMGMNSGSSGSRSSYSGGGGGGASRSSGGGFSGGGGGSARGGRR